MPKAKATASSAKFQKKLVQDFPTNFLIQANSKSSYSIIKQIGFGGFGRIYSCCPTEDKKKLYAVKIEYRTQKKLDFLGIPRYYGSGKVVSPSNEECRFLITDLFASDLESSLSKGTHSLKDIPAIAIRTLHSLRYIHSVGYAHADLKAANLLKNGSGVEYFLLDFGIASLYQTTNGVHKEEIVDKKRKHDGTLEFSPRDSHTGLIPTRRWDMESFFINIVHWLARASDSHLQSDICAALPWTAPVKDPKVREKVTPALMEKVAQLKFKAFEDPKSWLASVKLDKFPALFDLFGEISNLTYKQEPDYVKIEKILRNLQCQLPSPDQRKKRASNRQAGASSSPAPDMRSPAVKRTRLSQKKSTNEDAHPVLNYAQLAIVEQLQSKPKVKSTIKKQISNSSVLADLSIISEDSSLKEAESNNNQETIGGIQLDQPERSDKVTQAKAY
ncbi:Serine/threonine-protein kinase vrk1 [Cichlidogyrus casuarinus]|uniref:Serine/threonine-protein kinase vrk1 n=1 Tax=Cichlidogyrus casuarinus TaxID=1844966 RepID=A0ABD2Q3E7_9PLAT